MIVGRADGCEHKHASERASNKKMQLGPRARLHWKEKVDLSSTGRLKAKGRNWMTPSLSLALDCCLQSQWTSEHWREYHSSTLPLNSRACSKSLLLLLLLLLGEVKQNSRLSRGWQDNRIPKMILRVLSSSPTSNVVSAVL